MSLSKIHLQHPGTREAFLPPQLDTSTQGAPSSSTFCFSHSVELLCGISCTVMGPCLLWQALHVCWVKLVVEPGPVRLSWAETLEFLKERGPDAGQGGCKDTELLLCQESVSFPYASFFLAALENVPSQDALGPHCLASLG